MTALDFIIICFCVYRVSHLISQEDGPFEIIFKFRKLLGKSWLGKLMDCFYCISIWFALFFTFIFVKDEIGKIVLESFAISGAAIAIHKITLKQDFNSK